MYSVAARQTQAYVVRRTFISYAVSILLEAFDSYISCIVNDTKKFEA